MQVLGWDTASRCVCELPLTIGASLNDPAQPLPKVTLNGAHIHLKVLGKLVLINSITLVQACEDVGQTLRQFSPFDAELAEVEADIQEQRSNSLNVTIGGF